MRPHFAITVPEHVFEKFRIIREIIENIPPTLDFPVFIGDEKVHSKIMTSNGIPNCHVWTRAFALFFGDYFEVHSGHVVEGRYQTDGRSRSNGHEHSWLTIKGYDPAIVVDVWPLGSVSGPAIFYQTSGLEFKHECCFLQEFRTKKFEVWVERTRKAVAETYAKLYSGSRAA